MQTTDKTRIRIAKTKDLFEIAQLEDSYIVNREQHFLRLVLFPANFVCGFVVVAKDSKSEIIGYSYALRALDPETWYLGYIYVKENARNNRIAKKMQLRVQHEVRKRGGKKIFATVSPDNIFSMKLLLNGMGWHGDEFRRDYYGKGEHRIIASKNLLEDLDAQPQGLKSATLVNNNDYANLTRLLKANHRIIGVCRREGSVFLALAEKRQI